MATVCRSCAKPLKAKNVMNKGVPTVVYACKSPICKLYGKGQ